jgi:hypothetical protein
MQTFMSPERNLLMDSAAISYVLLLTALPLQKYIVRREIPIIHK